VNLDVNFTRSDVNLFNCWYSNDTYLVNSTQDATCNNITNVVWSEGQHNVTVWVNDTSGNENFARISFSIDSINPDINITYPINNTVTDVNSDVDFTRSDTNLFNCWYSNDTYLVNSTPDVTCGNITSIIWSLGNHNITVWVNDTFGNINWSSITFDVTDEVGPEINITFPINNTIWNNVNLDIDFTRLDPYLESCWYSNDTYLVNSTPDTDCNNITDVVWSEGQHDVTVWANDTSGNENFARISFTIDTIKSNINIIYPINNTEYLNTLLDVNYTVSDETALGSCWWSNDTYSVNHSLTDCGTNITDITWSMGNHNVTVWVSDISGNINWSSVTFDVAVDVINPNINITFPINDTNYTDVNLDVTFTRSDKHLESCWYSNDTYLVNSTPDVTCGNITDVVWSLGIHHITVWANDTSGNINWSSITFNMTERGPTSFRFQNKSGSDLMVIYGTGDVTITGKVTADSYYGDGSQLDNLPSAGNLSWNQSFANTLYWDINSGSYNATYDSFTLNVSRNWTEMTFDEWGENWYNHTDEVFNTWDEDWTATFNTTYDSFILNVSRNWTEMTFDTWDEDWTATFNTTYDSFILNVSRNWTEMAFDTWGENWYNHTDEVFNTWDEDWTATFNITYDSFILNVSRNWTEMAFDTWGENWYNHTLTVFTLWNSTWDESGWVTDTFLSIENSGWNRSSTDVFLGYPEDNVGIGTETPTHKLNVVGTFNTTVAGSSLVADASGNIKIGI
jgi:hypothetical protein